MDNPDDGISFIDLTVEERTFLLDALGYGVDQDGYILDLEKEKPYKDSLSKEAVHIENASILPSSTVIINTSPLSLSEYFTTFIEKAREKP